MSICPKNKHSKSRRDMKHAQWKMAAPTLVKCSKCGALMRPAVEDGGSDSRKVQQVRRSHETPYCLQGLRKLQQEGDHQGWRRRITWDLYDQKRRRDCLMRAVPSFLRFYT